MGIRKAIYIPFSQGTPNIYTIDKEHCPKLIKDKCGLCEKICPTGAINYQQKEQEIQLEVGAIVTAVGFDSFLPRSLTNLGFGKYKDVVTSLQYERLSSASGPTGGHIVRPSSGEEAKKIAFIHCVGSRDVKNREFCSSVCCMYATKEAVIAKSHNKEIDTAVFFMDMRSFGKEFDQYILRAKKDYGVRYVRSKVSSISQSQASNKLTLRYSTEEGPPQEKEFDLVVLAGGLHRQTGSSEMAELLGIELNRYGFCSTTPFDSVETGQAGIFVCGAFQEPKDIPETVTQSSAAAAKVSAFLRPPRQKPAEEGAYPAEIDITQQPPHIGVFVCRCGTNIGDFVNVPEVVEYARTLPYVVYAEENLYSCSQDAQEKIKEKIQEHKLNRVVVASCTPRTHQPLFQETLRQAGLNKYLFEMANIREQCSWVHMSQPEEATQKAKDLTRMAVARAQILQSLVEVPAEIIPKGLVVGGGLAGMTAALSLAEQGYQAYLIEKEAELGGNFRRTKFSLPLDDNPQKYLQSLIEKVESNELVEVYTEAEIKEVAGFIGSFQTTVLHKGKEAKLDHGAIIVATGGEELKPSEYLYGKDERVVTGQEFEELLAGGDGRIGKSKSITIILCVGSREEGRLYCSRICCLHALKTSLKLRRDYPDLSVSILYKDIMSYGFSEDYYRRAREEGVVFLRYDDDHKPSLLKEGHRLKLTHRVQVLGGEEIVLYPDMVVLNAAIIPGDNSSLAKMLKVPLTGDGFFLEAHMKLRPVDFATDGVFLCGLAHSPKSAEESITQAHAAASRAVSLLSQTTIEAPAVTAEVDEERCRACGKCVEVCEYSAPELVDVGEGRKAARINPLLCKGCGACPVLCPSSAITLKHFTSGQIISMIDAALKVVI
ncbi:MAG: FAD-dependent oxidoreductase [Acidobacteriota bacterium]